MKKLPIGIQTFKTIREENFAYVDKTEIAYNLIDAGRYYFLSRPRRFGKSLFLDTLSEIFKGNKELFEDLAIYDKWDWDRKFPVIKIDFGTGRCNTQKALEQKLKTVILFNAKELDVDLTLDDDQDCGQQLFELIYAVHNKYNEQVVILIDEYDKPIIDNIMDKEQSKINRDILASFYSTIKGADSYLRFVMLTGVSKFSKVNLFSNLNNLEDITIDKKYATITGYTQDDLELCFAEYLNGVDLEMVKRWYNGYNYFGDPIYNPFDILLFFSKGCTFKNYWWETGNSSFLVELLRQQKHCYLPELENIIVTSEVLDAFDVDHISLVALLWQTGYLTFAEEIIDDICFSISYKMKIPNLEIQRSLNSLFLEYLTDLNGEKLKFALQTSKGLREGDIGELEDSFKRLFAAIANSNYTKNLIADYEGYYASVIFTHIASIGYELIAEDYTNKGRIDLTVKVVDKIYIFEFKVDNDEAAMKQIKERKYYEKYQEPGKTIYLIGINFSSEEKNITNFEWVKI